MSDFRSPVGAVRGQTSRVFVQRPAPLTPGELRAVAGWSGQGRPWRHVAVSVAPADGPGTLRAVVSLTWLELDLELQELDALTRSLRTLVGAVPGASVSVEDPAAVFCLDEGELALWGAGAQDPVTEDAVASVVAVTRPTDMPAPRARDHAAGPASEGELSDLLQALSRVGPRWELLRAGAGPAVVHAQLLEDLAQRGVLGAATVSLLADLGRRGLLDVDALEPLADRFVGDGDRSERDAARELLAAIRRSSQVDRTNTHPVLSEDELGYAVVPTVGARLLEHPSLSPDDDDDAEWEDDLLGDDLLLLDPDAAVPESPVEQALRALDEPARVEAARTLAERGDFAEEAVAALTGEPAEIAGACGLLVAGAWPPAAIPGVRQLLTAQVLPGRPRPLRILAAAALGCLRRPDALEPLRVILDDVDEAVARTAMRALGRVPGAAARRLARARLTDDRLAAHAVAAVADAGDVVAFRDAAVLATHADADVRRSAAAHLDRIGGRRAIPALTRLYREDESWQVQLEAAGALARRAREAELGRLLDTTDIDVYARIIRALGEADRADALARLTEAARHPRSSVREAAAEAFGTLGLTVAAPTLIELVGDANPDVRIAAVEALERCGDRRAVHALRRNAGREDETGAVARRVLRSAWRLRQAPPDGRVRIRVVSEAPMPEDLQDQLAGRLREAGLSVRLRDVSVEATGAIDPADLAALARIARAVDTLAGLDDGLRWSVRDGLYALRRDGQEWIVSGQRGEVVRDAGWFEEALPAPNDRPPLTAIRQSSLSGMSPLPISIVQNLGGREQVRIEVEPDRAADPDEITGEVPPRAHEAPEAPEGPSIDDELLLEPEDDDATADNEASGSSARPVPRTLPTAWDDLLSEARSDAAFAALQRRGLTDRDRQTLDDWLASGLPGLMKAACKVARLTGETAAVPTIAGLHSAPDAEVRAAAAAALVALGGEDPLAAVALEALADDSDEAVRAAAAPAES